MNYIFVLEFIRFGNYNLRACLFVSVYILYIGICSLDIAWVIKLGAECCVEILMRDWVPVRDGILKRGKKLSTSFGVCQQSIGLSQQSVH